MTTTTRPAPRHHAGRAHARNLAALLFLATLLGLSAVACALLLLAWGWAGAVVLVLFAATLAALVLVEQRTTERDAARAAHLVEHQRAEGLARDLETAVRTGKVTLRIPTPRKATR